MLDARALIMLGAMPEEHPVHPPKRALITVKGLCVLFVGSFLLLGGVIWGAQWFVMKTGGDLVANATQAFEQLFKLTPQLTVHSGSVIMEKAAIAELAVTQRKVRTVVTYKQQWLGSTKVLIVQGDFLVKAGFDLNQSFRFSVDQATREVTVDFAKPKILSTDFKSMDVIFSSDGIINHLTPEDSQAVVQQMLAETKLQSLNSDIRDEAMQQIQQRVKDLLSTSASKVNVRFHDGMLPPATASLQ